MKNYRIDTSNGLEIGLYSLGDHIPNPATGERISATQRLKELIEAAKLAEEAGLDVFGVGESHQEYFATQAHTVVLSAIAQATSKIKIISSSSIVSTTDPVRLYEDFATIDLISHGRAEIVGGRASRVGLFQLLGYDVKDYEELFEEKFELLNRINKEDVITWKGNYRAPLTNAKILPRPTDGYLPIWRAVGGPPASAIKAGNSGVPMMLTTLGGPASSFKIAVDAYRNALTSNGFHPEEIPLATTGLFYVAEDSKQAMREAYPHINHGLELVNGYGFPKQHFAQAIHPHNTLNVGSPEQLIEKILYQHEIYNNQRYLAQIDFGGVPFDKIIKIIDILGNKIIPAVKKYTKS